MPPRSARAFHPAGRRSSVRAGAKWLGLALLLAGSLRAQLPDLVDVEDGMPPPYRKVALSGRPFGDPMPQDRTRSDVEPEQTCVDAMTLRLQHRTTDIYVSIVQSDFALEVNRNVEASQWVPGKGLAPAQRPDLPFGNCWSSGLAANVHLTERGPTEPVRVSVTDEQGTLHSFVAAPATPAGRRYLPLPSARSDQDWTRMQLGCDAAGQFVFRRKFGTTLLFRKEPSVVLTAPNGGTQERHSFFRLVSVNDRFGSKIDYQFDGSNHGVIPNEIAYRTQRIRIELNQAGVVERLVDPAGGDALYEYRAPTQPGGAPLLVAHRQPLTGEVRAATHYEYEEVTAGGAGPPGACHCNVARIGDPRDKTYEFAYAPDPARPGPEAPRCLSTVTLPDALGVTRFFNYSRPAADGSGIRRQTFMSDALGNGRLYEFTDGQVVRPVSTNGKSITILARIAVYGGETVSHFSGSEHEFSEPQGKVLPKGKTALLARESYEFDPDAGLALKKVIDTSGNGRRWTYDDPLTTEWRKAGISLPLASRCGDPTAFTDALGAMTGYGYEPAFRLLTQTTDAAGRITCQRLEGSCARLASTRVYADAGKLQRDEPFTRTDFEYARQDFPGFVTRKIIRQTSASPEKLSWEHDLVTSFDCDDLGTMIRETADPGGMNQTKVYTHDENGNRHSVTFPSGYRIDFKYDAVNHLTRIFRPTDDEDGRRSAKILEYNLRGDKSKEVDPNGATRTFDYDAMAREIRETDYAPGGFPDKPERTVEQQYNVAGSRTRGVSSKGQTYRQEFDGLQRVSKIMYSDGSSATYGYEKNCGDGLFDSSSWKSTDKKVDGGSTTVFRHDAANRQVEAVSTPSNPSSPTQRMVNHYDAVGNLLLEIGPQEQRTAHEYDPLNRVIKTTLPDGKSERTLYTSTGLQYATIEASGKRVEQAFDATGAAIEKDK